MASPQFVSSSRWRSVMVYVFAIISVMMSTRKYAVNAMTNNYKQRPLLPIVADHDDEVDAYHNLEMADASDEQPDRSLLSVAFQPTLRRMDTGQTQCVEVHLDGTVRDLRAEAALFLGVAPNAVELRYQGQLIPTRDDNVPLADTGMSNECEVEVSIARNDIDDFLKFLGDDRERLVAIYPERMALIHEMKDEALKRAADAESVDFSEVIQQINRMVENPGIWLSVHEGEPRLIERIEIDLPMTGRRLQWQYLPPSTQEVTLSNVGATEINLEGIECANLRTLKFWSLPNLSRLNLDGIQMCTSLTTLSIASNPVLRHLDWTRLSGCASLQYVYLYENALTDDLDLSPLRECPLEFVSLSGNAFSDARRADFEQALTRAGCVAIDI